MAWLLAVVFGVTTFVLLAIQWSAPSDSNAIVAIGLGVLSAVLVTGVLRFFENRRPSDAIVAMNQLHDDISSLGNKLRGIKQLGIYRFDQRSAFDDAYWMEQINNVVRTCSKNTTLVLVGRDLDNWVSSTFSDVFYNATVKILKSGGSIRMITLDPKGNAGKIYQDTTGQNLDHALKALDNFITLRVKPNVSLEEFRRLEKGVSEVPLTFTMFRSDAMLWVSPYLSLKDSASNLALSCGVESPLARAILNDFNALWLPKPSEAN